LTGIRPGRQQRLLHRILGIPDRTEHPVAVHLQFPLVRLDELAEGVPIAGPGQVKHVRGHTDIIA
jgi:hypothetical protein